MTIIFGAADKAAVFLRIALDDKAPFFGDFIAAVQELATAGKVRVGDPVMYNGNAPVYPLDGFTAEDQDRLAQLYKAAMAAVNAVKEPPDAT
jgi:hypothetical protein